MATEEMQFADGDDDKDEYVGYDLPNSLTIMCVATTARRRRS